MLKKNKQKKSHYLNENKNDNTVWEKVQFLFFLYIMNHNIIFNSFSQYSSTHALIYASFHSLTSKSIIQSRRGSLPHKPFSIFVTVLHLISPPAPFVYTVNHPVNFYCSLSLSLFYFCNGTNTIGLHSGAVVSTLASQHEGPGF